MNSKVAIFEKIIDLLTKQSDSNQQLLNQFNELPNSTDGTNLRTEETGGPTGDPKFTTISANISTSILAGSSGMVDIGKHPILLANVKDVLVDKTSLRLVTSFPNNNLEFEFVEAEASGAFPATAHSIDGLSAVDDDSSYILIDASAETSSFIKIYSVNISATYDTGNIWLKTVGERTETKDIYIIVSISIS